jgi:hypothetical protein
MKPTGCERARVRGISMRNTLGRAFLALAGCLPCPESSCRAAGVSVSIHLDAESAEIIRGIRRANGIDPPDPAADQRLAEILARASDRKRNPPALARRPVIQPLPANPTISLRSNDPPFGSGDLFSRVDGKTSQNGNGVFAVWIHSGRSRCRRDALAVP